jgi:hypothetical protein
MMGLRAATAAVVMTAMLGGCFGYNSSAKKWAYVGDSFLIVGGGATIAADLATRDPPCTGPMCPVYRPPIEGALLAGVVLATAGVVGILINATRPTVKTSR